MRNLKLVNVMLPATALLLAVVIGLFASTGNRYLVLLALSGLVAGFLLSLSMRATMYLLAATVFLLAGTVMYFGGISQALLAPYAFAIALTLKLFRFGPRVRTAGAGGSAIEWLLVLLVLAGFGSAFANLSSPFLAFAGLKSLIGFVPIAFLVGMRLLDDEAVVKIWKFIAVLPIFQLPYVLYQYFVVSKQRGSSFGATGVAWDSVVGSFGGNPESGGASGVLAFLSLASAFLAISFYRRQQLPGKVLAATLLSAITCIVLAEVKVIAVLLPLGAFVYLLPEMRRYPVRALASLAICVVGAVAVIYAYTAIQYTGRNVSNLTPEQLYEKTFGYSTDPEYLNLMTGEMGRTTALKLWWTDSWLRDPLHGTIGYGPGASRGKSAFGVGEVARRYRFFIDRSAATQILWDFGVLGLLIYVALPVAGGVAALRLKRRMVLFPGLESVASAAPALFAMAIMMVPYGRDLLEVPALNFTFMFLLGTVILMQKRSAVQPRAHA